MSGQTAIASPARDLFALAKQINEEHQAAVVGASNLLAHAIAAGDLLIQAKREVGHGKWLGWLRDNFEGSEDTAQRYMRASLKAQDLDSNTAGVRYLSLASLLGSSEAGKLDVHFTSDSPEWYTPMEIIERVVKCLGEIDLDPCSNDADNPNVPAAEHFTQADNGLEKDWDGKVYMNPPYGREIVVWIQKLVDEFKAGRTTEAIALVPARTDTEWCRLLREFPRCFVWGRLNFSGHENSAPFPSMLVYMGRAPRNFSQTFADIGDTYAIL